MASEQRQALTQADGDEIKRLYAEGLSLREIGRRYNRTGERVRQYLQEQGVPRRSRSKPRTAPPSAEYLARLERCRDLVLQGCSILECAEQLGVGRSTVNDYKKKLGLVRPWRKDLSSEQFGRWTVIKLGEYVDSTAYWLCKCECGTKRLVNHHNLVRGYSKSCGCSKRESLKLRQAKVGAPQAPSLVPL
ncbi:hypothetical protein [Leptolyngbya sp. FACHB-261]|uniref:hypothetical protein n=1 Tax=Leptolyngbya sp. FACHB-261 TaxID=2692806 RepID=UPI00168A190D|nr:hypothetical protein [Leptolyngbya sp. FACHB-261]MBD2104670.1 hypothetical protein [Leptolyngbya sp. FACHB-261]